MFARAARSIFIGIFFAPVAGALAGTLVEAACHWNAEPGGTWLTPLMMGLSGGFLRGSITGLLLGLVHGWILSSISLERGTAILFTAILFASLLGIVLQPILGFACPLGTVNLPFTATFLAWIAGAALIRVILFFHNRPTRRMTP